MKLSHIYLPVFALVLITSQAAAQNVPPPLIADPYSEVFIITGSQAPGSGTVGNHYFPIYAKGVVGQKTLISGTGHVDGADVGDMDGDGDLDFMLRDDARRAVFLYTNEGSGYFSPTLVVNDGIQSNWTTYLRIDDFNGDGANDFVLGDYSNQYGTKVYLQSSTGSFSASATLDTSWAGKNDQFYGIATGCLNSDQTVDIALFNYQTGELALYFGDGAGDFYPPIFAFSLVDDFGAAGPGLAALDLEGDGDLDLAVGGAYQRGEVYVYENDGNGSFTKPATFVFDVDAETGLDAFDIDMDGDHDMVIVTWQTSSLFVAKNVGGILSSPQLIDSNNGKCIGVGAPPLLGLQKSVGISPEQLKLDAVDALTKLLTGDKKTDVRLALAGKHLVKSLDQDLWVDDSHLTDRGEMVFTEEKIAVKKLMDEQKDKKSVFAVPDLQAVIDSMVECDRELAMIAIDEAIDAGGDAKKISAAQGEINRALDELAKGRFDHAIQRYRQAWKMAVDAL